METDYNSDAFKQRLANKDHDSFNKVIIAYSDYLNKNAMKYGFFGADMHELVQNVWVMFYEKSHNFNGQSHIKTYITGILINKARELKRERIRHTNDKAYSFEEVYFSKLRFCKDPQEKLNERESLKAIAQSFEKLPKSQKQAFDMKILQDLSTNHVCKEINISPSNLGVLVHRARKSLEKDFACA